MSVMSHKGYQARVEYDDEDGILVGKLAGINDSVTFHAEDVPGLRAAFEEAVDDYVATCEKVGKEPEKAYSGKVMFRVDPSLHKRAALAAELAGKSLNQWAEEVLDKATSATGTPWISSVSRLDPLGSATKALQYEQFVERIVARASAQSDAFLALKDTKLDDLISSLGENELRSIFLTSAQSGKKSIDG